MKFKCGLKHDKRVAARKQWHRHFAWWPVKLAQYDCRWLEWVERRGHTYDGWYYEYREIVTK